MVVDVWWSTQRVEEIFGTLIGSPNQDAKAQPLKAAQVAFLKLSDHPNTVRYYETFEDAKDIHLVMATGR